MSRQNNKEPSMTFTTKDLVDEVFSKTRGVTKGKVKMICDEICLSLCEQLKQKNSVRLNYVGVIKARDMAERKGRNPVTGEVIGIPPRTGYKFQLCRGLDDFLNKGVPYNPQGDED